jgi:hypothetical protein
MNGRLDATRELDRDAGHTTSNGTIVGGDPATGADSEADDLVGIAGPGEPDPTTEKGTRSATVAEARRLLATLTSWAMRQPLEATAVVLLGVGGGIYPPSFLLGALVALGSRQWDLRDKWAGLILPLVLTVIGAAIGLAAGGRSHGLHEGWVFLNVVSRLAAVLGAGYLAWRSWQGRRPPRELPWEKSHRGT